MNKDFTNMGSGGTILGGVPVILGAPTTEFRFYPGLAAPSSISNVTMASFWSPSGSPGSGGPQPYQETIRDRLLSRTKANNGFLSESAIGASFADAALSNPYTVFWDRFVSEPCESQSLAGFVTCVIAQEGPTQGLTALSAAVIAISADGSSRTVIGTAQGAGLALNANELFRTVVVPVFGAVELGGRIGVELGATFADFDGTVNEGVEMWRGSQLTFGGAAQADGLDGATDGNLKTGHVTFSNGLTVRPTQWLGGIDVCGGAWNLGSADPLSFGPLDTTKSPGIDASTANIRNTAWFSWTAPTTGRVTIDSRGSNYYTSIKVHTACGGNSIATTSLTPFIGRSWDSLMFDATAGVTYLIQFASFGIASGSSSFRDTALQSGGSLSFHIFTRSAPQTDDLYVAGKGIYVYRKIGGVWVEVNHNNNLTGGLIPTGLAFDYSRSGVPSQNAGESTSVDLLLSGLFFFTLLEAFNAITLNEGQSEYNFQDMTFSNVGPGASMPSGAKGGNQKVIPQSDGSGKRVQGRAIVGTEGDNYSFYGGLSSAAGAGFWEVELVPEWWAATPPNFKTRVLAKHTVALENQSTDHFDIMPDLDTILYTSAGQRILRYRMSDTTQLSDFVSNVPSSDSARPGARGVKISPKLEVFVAIGSKVHHYSASGSLIKTMQSNNPSRHGSLERMAWRSDGRTLMVVDVTHSDVLEFDTVSGAHVATLVTGLPVGNLCGIACYRGFEQPPPPPPPDPPPGEPPPTGEPPPSSGGPGQFLPIRRQRAAPHLNAEQTWIFYSRLQVDLETGVGLESGQGVDPQIMMDYSDDGGHTWCNEQWRSAGRIGEFKRRALWRRLGRSRDRIYRITVSDPVKWAFVDAYLEHQGGTS
jgi:hypothetical protein